MFLQQNENFDHLTLVAFGIVAKISCLKSKKIKFASRLGFESCHSHLSIFTVKFQNRDEKYDPDLCVSFNCDWQQRNLIKAKVVLHHPHYKSVVPRITLLEYNAIIIASSPAFCTKNFSDINCFSYRRLTKIF